MWGTWSRATTVSVVVDGAAGAGTGFETGAERETEAREARVRTVVRSNWVRILIEWEGCVVWWVGLFFWVDWVKRE